MELVDRARGAMVGLAAGNLLGIKFEFGWDANRIRRHYPNGITEIEAKPGFPDDDDLAQAIALADACTGVDRLEIEDFARHLWEWAELNGAGMGPHTRRTLRRYGGHHPQRELRNEVRKGVRPTGEVRKPEGMSIRDASYEAWYTSRLRYHDYNAGNGSIMRCAPVAIRWWYDDLEVVRSSVVSAAATHWDPRCLWSAALSNLATASHLRARPQDIEPVQLLLRVQRALHALSAECAQFDLDPFAPPKPVLDALFSALEEGAQVQELGLEGANNGYVIVTLKAALWAAKHPESFEHGLSDVVCAGGDTDTNAAAAGAVLGARFGIDAIPARWRQRIDEIRSDNGPLGDWPERRALTEYADQLLEVGS